MQSTWPPLEIHDGTDKFCPSPRMFSFTSARQKKRYKHVFLVPKMIWCSEMLAALCRHGCGNMGKGLRSEYA